jgi:alkaline phosphatase
MKRILSISLTFLVTLAAYAQQLPIIYHSHNDYNRTVPFWEAYSQHCASIEADVFLQDGEILVAHNRKDVTAERSLRKMYIEPIVKTFRENGGRMWKGSDDRLQLVVDLKTGESLPGVIALAEEYPDVFTTENGVKIVITGNEPAPEDFGKWPSWLWFDGDFKDGKLNYTPEQLKRIAMISTDFRKFARNWNGKGRMINSELEAVTKAIETAHEAGKPIRFWDAPEGTTAYFTLHKLGVDFFNTDYPAQCALFFSNWTNKNFRIGRHAVQAGVTGTKRLDKATRDFQGFQNEKMQLSKGIEVYSPTYRNDASNKKIKNVIFLIGDGMGLGQILSGAYANGRDLSMLRMKMMGLQFYNPNDDFIGDSASGGSALATGELSWTRHIAANEDGSVEYPNLCDYFHAQGKATGVVTLGDLADATPSVFYAHTAERDSIEKVTRYLATNKSLDLLAGSGTDYFEDPREDGFDLLKAVKANGFNYTHDALSTNSIPGRVICADQRMREYAREETLGFLADITRESIAKMQSMSRKGFFLMVEGAKIDYAGHSDCLPASIIETLSFDLAVAEALKFADSNGETLVVVTADHETGGLTILDGDLATGHVLAVYNSDDHTPSALPVFAYGPGSQHFTGTYMNIEIPRTIKRLVKK